MNQMSSKAKLMLKNENLAVALERILDLTDDSQIANICNKALHALHLARIGETMQFLRECSLERLDEADKLADKLAAYFALYGKRAERRRVLDLKTQIIEELKRRLFPTDQDQSQDRDAGNDHTG